MLKLVLTVLLAAGAYSRVVNGKDARPYSWPWQVSLQYQMGGGFQHSCGGSLISPNWVLTAGHCISYKQSYRIVLGEYDRNVEEGAEQYIPVNSKDIFVHPKWDMACGFCGYDIALIKLSNDVQLNDKVEVGYLPPAGQLLSNDYPCYISGWGRLDTEGPLATILQQALLPVVDHAYCTQEDWWGSIIKESMLCAGGYNKAACNSDSGGPLSCQAPDGRWYIHGITSFGPSERCNILQKPTVFTRVSAYNDWIEEIITNNLSRTGNDSPLNETSRT
ncbi:proproteinase E-like [Ascaphus truei]|uniref:proproteinase E-like n=1 Tax=Ascaphus truei TaxID=8439 RepID=UPI003F5A909F